MRFTLPSGPLCAAFQLEEDVSISPRDASHTHTYLNAIRHRLLAKPSAASTQRAVRVYCFLFGQHVSL